MKHTRQDLNIMQGWSLEKKIKVSQMKILEWYREYNGQVLPAFQAVRIPRYSLIWHGRSARIFPPCMLTQGWNTLNCAIL